MITKTYIFYLQMLSKIYNGFFLCIVVLTIALIKGVCHFISLQENKRSKMNSETENIMSLILTLQKN